VVIKAKDEETRQELGAKMKKMQSKMNSST
jgi:hypothetical protein